MSFIDYINDLLQKNKNNAKFINKTLIKTYGEPEPLEVALYDGNQPLDNVDIGIEINNKKYIKKTDENGIATLNINLGVGEYTAKLYYPGNNEYNNVTGYAEVFVKGDTYMEGTDVEKTFGSDTKYQTALYDSITRERIYDEVIISVNGKEYKKTPNDEGLYELAINLGPGIYTITSTFNGNTIYNSSSTINTIIVKESGGSPDKKNVILGCDSNTSDDSAVQNYIAERLEAEGYPVEKLAIEPNAFASYDWSGQARGKIGVYLIASGLFSIADAWANQGGFDNYVFGIRGDFGDKGATCFDCPIKPDSDCTSICSQFANKTFNEINAMVQPKIAIVGGESTERLADNMIDWLRALENREPETTPEQEEKSYSQEILEYFESKFGEMTCIDDCLEAIQGKGYGYYYDDAYTNYTSINRMANGSGVNCTDSCHVFWHLAVALGYRVEVLHIQCAGGDGHVRLELERAGTGTFYRDPAAVLDGNSLNYNWCTSGYTIAVNPDWFFENLYR